MAFKEITVVEYEKQLGLRSNKNKLNLLEKRDLTYLLTYLGIDLVVYNKENNRSIFYHYSSGFVFGGESKGIIFTTEKLDEEYVVDSIDTFLQKNWHRIDGKIKNGDIYYSKIKENWYIFYDYFD